MDYQEIIKNRLPLLPQTLQNFLKDEGWREETKRMAEKFKLASDIYPSFENEIALVLMCFEKQDDLSQNIARETGINSNIVGWISEDINKNILSKVQKEINDVWQQIELEEKPEVEVKIPEIKKDPIKIESQSFEQIILNQAKAMQPARPEGWVPPAPANLPTEILTETSHEIFHEPKDEQPRVIHNYTQGSDPYREATE